MTRHLDSARKVAGIAAGLAGGLAVAIAPPAIAEVLARSDTGFALKSTILVAATPQIAYDRAVRRIDRWWDPAHTYSGRSANLRLEPRPGGCFCERLDQRGGVQHLVVVFVQPGKVIRLQGGLGPLQELAAQGALTWSFKLDGAATRVTWTYRVSGLGPKDVDALAAAVDGMLNAQLARFGRFVDSGSAELLPGGKPDA